MASTKIPIELSSTPGIVDNSNATAITIDSSERVGIGISSPDKMLVVQGADAEIAISDTNSTPLLRFRENGTSAALIKTNSGKLVFTTRPSGGSLTDVGAFDTNGKFGIGTTSPSDYWGQANMLVVAGSSNRGITIQSGASGNGRLVFTDQTSSNPGFNDGGQIHYAHTDDKMHLRTAGGDRVTIDSSGNVGIGTTSPNQWASYTDNAATVLQVRDTSERARVVINGGNGAHLDLVDYAGGTNDKHMNIAVDGGILKFGSLNDAGNAFVQNNILNMDLGTGAIKFNNAYTFPTSDGSANQVLQTDGSGALSFGTISTSDNTKLPLSGGTLTGALTTNGVINTGTSHNFAINTPNSLRINIDSDNNNAGEVFVVGHNQTAVDASNGVLFAITAANERVGIGTGAPSEKLEVNLGDIKVQGGANATTRGLIIAHTGQTGNLTMLRQDASGSRAILETTERNLRISAGSGGGTGTAETLDFFVNGSERMMINTSGRVGIGTSSPNGLLHVGDSNAEGSSANPAIQVGGANNYRLGFYTDSEGGIIQNLNGDHGLQFRVKTAGEVMRIMPSGNVGIGTTSPGHKVHIYGGSAHTNLVISTADGYKAELRMTEEAAGTTHGGFIRYDGNGDYVRLGTYNAGAESINLSLKDDTKIGTGGITVPQQNFAVGTTTNYDPPGLGSSNANFAILKKDGSTGGNYGIITGVSSDGNVWSQVQRTDGTATGYNYYLQPSGGNVAIGVPQNHTYIPNLTVPLHVCKVRSGVGNVSNYLTHLAIEALGYAGSNYQLGCIDFNGGDTAGAHNPYARIGCSTMVGTNNQETGSLEFYVKAPGFSLDGNAHAIKITGKADTSSAGQGTTRNGVLFTYQGIAIDRSWANYPCLNILNSTPYSSTASTQSELRIHGNNVSSASYPGTSGSDFSVTTRSDGGYATGSDKRRKKNITTIDNALSTVKQLTGKRFQTINSVGEVQEHVSKNGYKLGFIAQEVEDIIPETVIYHEDEDDGTENYNSAYAMDYGSVVALLVNAIKEQDTTIQELEARIKVLENK